LEVASVGSKLAMMVADGMHKINTTPPANCYTTISPRRIKLLWTLLTHWGEMDEPVTGAARG